MTVSLVPEYGSPAWKAERRSYIGASDVPAILGLSPFGSAYDVWLAKKGLAEDVMSDAMRWGHYHEPNIAAEYQRAFPDVRLEMVGTKPHAKYPWLRATIDRMVHGPLGSWPLEIKSTSEYLGDRWGDVNTDDVPDHVNVQAQVQLMVEDKPFAHAAVLVGHCDCRLPYLIEADSELQEMILDRCHDFRERSMLGDEEPEITGPNAEAHLKKKYQKHTDVVRILQGEQAELHARLIETYRERKALEEVEKDLKAQVMAMIAGDYGVKSAAGKTIWYEVGGRSSVDTNGLITHLKVPKAVVETYTRTGNPSRTFRNFPAKEAA